MAKKKPSPKAEAAPQAPAQTVTAKKPIGRPKGSKNLPKEA
jgi:hypothetical protein